MKFYRILYPHILSLFQSTQKAIVIYGPRQVGKTTLANDVLLALQLKTLKINADEYRFADELSSRDSKKLQELVAGYELLFIDEAQKVPDIGTSLKILIDRCPTLKILITGSSSLELADRLAEPLTGRKWTVRLYPIATVELAHHYNSFELKLGLEDRLIWGSYPEIFQLKGQELKKAYLQELVSDYLLKDVFQLTHLRYSNKLLQLLQLLAFQVGSEVSLHELACSLGFSKETVGHYLDILEKCFVVFRLGAFSRNLRKEISKSSKYYFYDVGIRNALIQNFNALSHRDDLGRLWENFLLLERIKKNHYHNIAVNSYFWRTYTGAEIDYVEEGSGKLRGFEFTWRRAKKKPPKTWIETYSDSSWQVVDSENWLDFIFPKT